VCTVIKFGVQWKAGNFVTSWVTVSFLRRDATEQVVANKSDLFSEGVGFETWPSHLLSWLQFVVFLSSSRQVPAYYVKLCHYRFISHLFQFTVY
jgi:hypothetical protein